MMRPGCLLLMLCLPVAGRAASSPLLDIRTLSPEIRLDIRYATPDNFTGKPVDGYQAGKCLLLPAVAAALAKVELDLRASGHALVLYDCYRPLRAVAEFMRWAQDESAQSTKSVYYPDLDKSALVPDYIAPQSGHSRGATVDSGLLDCRSGQCITLDMGTPFDFFGPRANTAYPGLSAEQAGNRRRLLDAMAAHGFVNYPMEWWHFSHESAWPLDQAFDIPID